MKTGNIVSIAATEIKTEKRLFLFFEIILTLLFSVSVAVMDAAVFLPDYIADTVHENQMDLFHIDGFHSPDEVQRLLSKRRITFRVEHCDTPFVLQNAPSNAEGGVLFRDYLNENDRAMLYGELAEGETGSSFFDGAYAVISTDFAAESGLRIGDSVVMESTFHKAAVAAEICGIFEANAERNDYYVSEGANESFLREVPEATAFITISPENLNDIFAVRQILEDSGKPVFYSKEMQSTLRMLYITFYSVNIILLLALSGSVQIVIKIYMQRRNHFYAIQSAIGMSNRNMMSVLFCISEIITVGMLPFSMLFSALLLRFIQKFSAELFANPFGSFHFPAVPLLIDFLLVQLCLSVLMLQFRKKLKDRRIIDLLHEN